MRRSVLLRVALAVPPIGLGACLPDAAPRLDSVSTDAAPRPDAASADTGADSAPRPTDGAAHMDRALADAVTLDGQPPDVSILDARTPDALHPLTDALLPVADAQSPIVDAPLTLTDTSVPVVDASLTVTDTSLPIMDALQPVADTPLPAGDATAPADMGVAPPGALAFWPLDGDLRDLAGDHDLVSGQVPHFSLDAASGRQFLGPACHELCNGLSAPGLTRVDTRDGLTLAAWVYLPSTDPRYKLFGFGDFSDPSRSLLVAYTDKDLDIAVGGLQMRSRFDGGHPCLPYNAWVHLAIVVPADFAAGESVQVYVDGRLTRPQVIGGAPLACEDVGDVCAGAPVDACLTPPLPQPAESLALGEFGVPFEIGVQSAPVGGQPALSQVAIFEHRLDAGEIGQLMARWPALTTAPSLVSCRDAPPLAACECATAGPPCNRCPVGTVVPPGLICLSADTFSMGLPDNTDPLLFAPEALPTDEPPHPVRLTGDFLARHTEVTQLEWETAFAGTLADPSDEAHTAGELAPCDGALPVRNVTFAEALQVANALSVLDGLPPCYGEPPVPENETPSQDCTGWRLPTEAEWEYLSGAPQAPYMPRPETPFVAWFEENADIGQGPPRAQSVACLIPNRAGLYDTLGNVREWVFDRYAPDYGLTVEALGNTSLDVGGPPASRDCPGGAPDCRVAKGGGYDSPYRDVRSAAREAFDPTIRHPGVGVRLVRSLLP